MHVMLHLMYIRIRKSEASKEASAYIVFQRNETNKKLTVWTFRPNFSIEYIILNYKGDF